MNFCHHLAICSETIDGPVCYCPTGYAGSGIGPNGCIPLPSVLNPCSINPCLVSNTMLQFTFNFHLPHNNAFI